MAERAHALKALGSSTFDVVVVGGGITGAGIARDAALRGLAVALVEKDDLASGTSSKSSKLVHGGLRYLEMAELRLVFESVSERRKLMSLGRHLVRPLPFLVANFKGDRRFLATLDLGLWIYDAMCFFRSYRNHRTYGPRKTLQLEPLLRSDGLNGAILYYDCLTDDARLTLENALDARALGAVVVNHARATRLLRSGDRVSGLTVEDGETGAAIDVLAKVVVNATGPWTDEVRALAGEAPLLSTSKGVHVVVDAKRLPVRHALMLSAPRDQRVVFCIPWGLGRTVVGTTDTFFSGSPDTVEPTRDDVAYLLETANASFPSVRLTEDDVLATWSGLRPLLKPPEPGVRASQVSREHEIHARPGLVTIAGGKLTTYRRMAAEVVDVVLGQLSTTAKSTTAARPLPGAVGLEDSDDQLSALAGRLRGDFGLTEESATLFAETYGVRAVEVLGRVKADPTAGQALDDELPYLFAQVDEAVDTELARTLDDVLGRRVPLLLRARDQGVGVAPRVAERMGRRLGWSPGRVAEEVARFGAAVASSRRYRQAG